MSWLDTFMQSLIADGILTIAVSGSVVLTQAQYSVRALKFTGALGAAPTITMPLTLPEGFWFIENATSGNFALNFQGATGTAATVPPRAHATIYTDGVNFYFLGGGAAGYAVLPYSATIATTASGASPGNIFSITATNGTGFTVSNPTGFVAGQIITYDFKNSSGGSMGACTFGAAFLTAGAFQTPGIANGKRRTITFYFDGTNWVEVSRAAADI